MPWELQSDLVTVVFNGTHLITYFYETVYGTLVSQGLACPAGQDAADCGPSARTVPLLPNVNCTLNSTAQAFRDAQLNKTTVGITTTVTLQNLTTQLTGDWNATFTNMPLARNESRLGFLDCGGMVCPPTRPHRCDSGLCVQFKSQCTGDRYVCPGNGCV